MPDLNFEIERVAPQPYAVAPLLNFKLRGGNATGEPVHSVILRCEVMLEVARRRYNDEERHRVVDVFGDPEQWERTMRSIAGTKTSGVIAVWTGSTSLARPVH